MRPGQVPVVRQPFKYSWIGSESHPTHSLAAEFVTHFALLKPYTHSMHLPKLRWSSIKLTTVILRRIHLRNPRYAPLLSVDAVLNFLLGYEFGVTEGEDVSGRLRLLLCRF